MRSLRDDSAARGSVTTRRRPTRMRLSASTAYGFPALVAVMARIQDSGIAGDDGAGP